VLPLVIIYLKKNILVFMSETLIQSSPRVLLKRKRYVCSVALDYLQMW